jgi:hypothetical protein
MVGSDLMLCVCFPSYVADIDEIQYWELVGLICLSIPLTLLYINYLLELLHNS